MILLRINLSVREVFYILSLSTKLSSLRDLLISTDANHEAETSLRFMAHGQQPSRTDSSMLSLHYTFVFHFPIPPFLSSIFYLLQPGYLILFLVPGFNSPNNTFYIFSRFRTDKDHYGRELMDQK